MSDEHSAEKDAHRTPVACVLRRADTHRPGCEPDDCYCNVYCEHGRMGWGDCVACGYDQADPTRAIPPEASAS